MVRGEFVPDKIIFPFGISVGFEDVAETVNKLTGVSTSLIVNEFVNGESSFMVKPSMMETESTDQPGEAAPNRQRRRILCPAAEAGRFTIVVINPPEFPLHPFPLL